MSQSEAGTGTKKKEAEAPKGSGAALGFHLVRYSGIQGLALVGGNILQLATIAVVAVVLGPSDLGRYSLLLFLGALVTMIFSLADKPGTIRRTFGGGDDDDDDDDDEDKEIAAVSPKHTLGAGLLWAGVLGVLATALVVVFRYELGDVLLGGEHDAVLIMWAGVLGGAGILYKVASISLWFERRPSAFLVVEIARPALALIALCLVLLSGGGLEGAIAGTALGTLVAALLAVFFLRGSFEPNLEPNEVLQIAKGAGRRIPIVTPLWVMQNADVYLLSRFVDHADLGVYALSAKLGFIVSFLPQGFRVAMRPMRKSAAFKAVRSEYGRSTSSGQLLAYFLLLSITSVLMMVLAGGILIDIAPPEYAAAAGLIPFTAAALVMPALWRTINGQAGWPTKTRGTFVAGTIGAALIFIGLTILLAPEIGIYAAPIGMLAGLGIPVIYFFVRCQTGPAPMDFPYAGMGKALALAVGIGVGYHLLPNYNTVLEAIVATILFVAYLALLLRLRVVPEQHWPALSRLAGAVFSGQSHRFRPRVGLKALEADDTARLRVAVTTRMPPEELAAPAISDDPPAREKAKDAERTEGARLVRVMRGVGVAGGAEVMERSKWDGGIAEFLFADEPPAVRNASMRALLTAGAEATDLRALEDLARHLKKIPPDAWDGGSAADSPKARRRRAIGKRGRRAMARGARSFHRRL
ncbi:MAG: hypothetical protein ABI726_02915 [bacterium]